MNTKSKLQQLVDAAGPLTAELKTEEGKAWAQRLKRAETIFQNESEDWEVLQTLYSEPYKTLKLSDGTEILIKMPLGWSIIHNRNADLYYRNPDTYVQSRRAPLDRSKDRMIRDLAKTIHADCRTESLVREALENEGSHGFGVIWSSFEQDGHFYDKPIVNEETGEPILGEEGPVTEQSYEATHQAIRMEFVEAPRWRWDPDGRDWETLSDFKWIARMYERSLQSIWEDESIDLERRKMAVHACYKGRQKLTINGSRLTGDELDPRYIMLQCAEIWSLAEKRIVQMLAGEEWDLDAYDMPEEFAQANHGRGKYPARVIFINKPPRKKEDEQKFPIPTLRLIRGLLEDLNHLQELFVEAATNVINKYWTIEGLIDSNTFSNVVESHSREILFLKRDALQELFGPTNPVTPEMLKNVLQLFPTNDDAQKALNYAAMMERIEAQIYEITGQGPGDRGGVSESETATESANIRAQLDKRNADIVERIASDFDDITETIFILLSQHQTLPIPYKRSTGAFSQPVWDEFVEDLSDYTLSFTHAVDSSRPKNRAQVKAERREVSAVVMPFLQGPANPVMKRLAAWTLEPYDADEVLELLQDDTAEIAMQLQRLRMQVQSDETGQLAADEEIATQITELTSQLIQRNLTPADLEALATEDQATPSAGGAGTQSGGSTAGEQRAAEAAAGATVN
jgi:hypothetical protein